jgi:hypothetical protein
VERSISKEQHDGEPDDEVIRRPYALVLVGAPQPAHLRAHAQACTGEHQHPHTTVPAAGCPTGYHRRAKSDRWLVRTVAGLLVTNGVVQLATPHSPGETRQARRLGIGTAATLAAIDLTYVPKGRISPVYLVDAAVEMGWIWAWSRSR